MNPAPSVILFTSLSGLGFGYFAWLGIGLPDLTGWPAFAAFFLAYALSVGGLSASVFHLPNKKNAIRAFSQWRTSWLSREGVLAVAALLVFAVYAVGRIFFATPLPVFGIVGAALALATVLSTAMIYAQLKTIPRWNSPFTPLLYLAYAIAGGALMAMQPVATVLLLTGLTALQIVAWFVSDTSLARSGTSRENATGLGRIGAVRLYESAHTARNYVVDEMVCTIGRRHAPKLRVISAMLIGVVPAALIGLAGAGPAITALAILSHLAGVLASRWLFFAEAEHVVGLYYAKS